jgi:4-amino-4-deoxy-L-arabinose transferase-like glycosyltransferase
VCLAVAAPWYIHIARQASQAFWGQFVGYEIISRLVSAPHGHTGPPGYYLLVSLAGWLPWTALVPGAVIEAWRARRADRTAWLLLIWLGVPWLLLELVPSKLPHYILPCYVPLAILFGRMWDAGLQQPVTKGQRAVLGVWAAVPMVFGGLIIAVGGAWHRAAWSWAMCATGATLLLGFAAVAWMLGRQRLPAAWKSSVAALVAFHVVAGMWLLPALEPHRLSRLVAERANVLGTGVAEVVVCGYTEPTMFFYLRLPARVAGAEECARILADTAKPRVIIVRESELRAAGIEPREGPGAAGQGSALRSEVWERTAGFNYVKGRDEVVWVVRAGSPDGGGRPPGPTSSPRPGTGSPSF